MRIIFSDQPAEFVPGEKMIFLAGPTSRTNNYNMSWRKEAVEMFEALGYDGTICVPEFSTPRAFTDADWDRQTDWEWKLLDNATVIMFWVPRNDTTMPGLTTNLEFGTYIERCPERVVLGYPYEATHMQWMEKKFRLRNGGLIEHSLFRSVVGAKYKADKMQKGSSYEQTF